MPNYEFLPDDRWTPELARQVLNRWRDDLVDMATPLAGQEHWGLPAIHWFFRSLLAQLDRQPGRFVGAVHSRFGKRCPRLELIRDSAPGDLWHRAALQQALVTEATVESLGLWSGDILEAATAAVKQAAAIGQSVGSIDRNVALCQLDAADQDALELLRRLKEAKLSEAALQELTRQDISQLVYEIFPGFGKQLLDHRGDRTGEHPGGPSEVEFIDEPPQVVLDGRSVSCTEAALSLLKRLQSEGGRVVSTDSFPETIVRPGDIYDSMQPELRALVKKAVRGNPGWQWLGP